jgi:hypothetical protein
MNKIEVKAGESVTFGIRLPVDYDIAKLVDLTLKIGTNLYWRLGDELLGTADVRVFRAELDSAISARVSGKFAGKGLSANDYTNTEKTKLAAIGGSTFSATKVLINTNLTKYKAIIMFLSLQLFPKIRVKYEVKL